MPITPINGQVDPIFLGTGIAVTLILAAFYFHYERKQHAKKKIQLSSEPHCNLHSISGEIIRRIEGCWDEEDLANEHLKRIRKFEADHYGALNLDWYLKKLDNAYEQQKTNIYREQLRANDMLREMNMI